MEQLDIADFLPMLPWEGLPLPRFLGLFWPWVELAPEPPTDLPPNAVAIGLKNPPSRGNYWLLYLYDEAWGTPIKVGEDVPVDQFMIQEIPAEWRAPAYLELLIYERQESPHNIVYQVQSAYGPDWPNYKELLIPDYGIYYYDVDKGQLEKI